MRTGRVLAGGGIGALVFNALFPRATDPWDAHSVLTMMAEHSVRRQLAFLGATVSVVLISAAVVRLGWQAGPLGRAGAGMVGAGSVLFTAAAALGLAATGAARSWMDAGADPSGVEFAIAAALNRADDYVWYVSIAVLWIGLGMVGLALWRTGFMPRWSGPSLAVVGVVAGVGVGGPLAFGVELLPLVMAFGVLAVLTSVWAVVVGIRLARRPVAR